MKTVAQRLVLGMLLLHAAAYASAQEWKAHFSSIGTFSSPRLSDLNQDGTLDVVLGAGKAEFESSDTAVIALNGADGSVLWVAPADDQIFGSALLLDLTGDGVDEVVIGGRSAELMALNGATGQELWRFRDGLSQDGKEGGQWYNFYNAQQIDDCNGDGTPDILVSNGGDVLVEPYDPDRPVGHLVIISGATGGVLARAAMPDEKEIYMSVVLDAPHLDAQILFGTGGETIGGSFYRSTLDAVLREDLSKAQLLCSSPDKGFIAPPAWVDLTGDGVLDMAVLAVDGWFRCFEGVSGSLLWETLLPNTEAYSSMAVGYFTEDNVPDFFCSVAEGEWPKLEWNRQFLLSGKDGTLLRSDSLGFYQTSSPIAGDLTGDGKDEVLLSVNYQEFDSLHFKYFRNMLVAINQDLPEPIQLLPPLPGSNISSTPWMGDMDADGRLDIVYVHGTNDRQTYTFDGMSVMRLKTDIVLPAVPGWGGYMGNAGNGIFPARIIKQP